MSSTKPRPTDAARRRLPARLTDALLDHMERMDLHWTRDGTGLASRGIDREYWKNRLRTLSRTYDLVMRQR